MNWKTRLSCWWFGHKLRSWNIEWNNWCSCDHGPENKAGTCPQYEDFCYFCPEKCERCGTIIGSQVAFLQRGDLVQVEQSPGAPFDIGKVFTVDVPNLPGSLKVLVNERPYRFHHEWLRKLPPGSRVPSETMVRINGHDMLEGKCIKCQSMFTSTICKGAPK